MNIEKEKYVAMDCEFATTDRNMKNESIVISISIVDYYGNTLLNTLI